MPPSANHPLTMDTPDRTRVAACVRSGHQSERVKTPLAILGSPAWRSIGLIQIRPSLMRLVCRWVQVECRSWDGDRRQMMG